MRLHTHFFLSVLFTLLLQGQNIMTAVVHDRATESSFKPVLSLLYDRKKDKKIEGHYGGLHYSSSCHCWLICLFFFFWEICCANFTSQVVRKSIINLFLAFDKSIQSEIFTGIVAMKQLFYRFLIQSRPWPRQRTEDLMSEGLITVLLVGWGKINYSNTAIFAQGQHTWTENRICNLCQKNCWVFFFRSFLCVI